MSVSENKAFIIEEATIPLEFFFYSRQQAPIGAVSHRVVVCSPALVACPPGKEVPPTVCCISASVWRNA